MYKVGLKVLTVRIVSVFVLHGCRKKEKINEIMYFFLYIYIVLRCFFKKVLFGGCNLIMF